MRVENDFQLYDSRFPDRATRRQSTLCDLEVGASARVEAVAWDVGLTVRLLEMGLVPGTRVSVIKRAPLRGPLELAVRGYHLSLRRDEARLVLVETAN
ncbi:MAG: ferrous iron transport protein A [Myxococcales bacterium FL481]|nr:MAG: ferrous iron transport protein A [Myxococcales bacterium FL481]